MKRKLYDLRTRAGRVAYASECIASDMQSSTREYDSCFESGDGWEVVQGILSRGLNDPRLRRGLYDSPLVNLAQWLRSFPFFEPLYADLQKKDGYRAWHMDSRIMNRVPGTKVHPYWTSSARQGVITEDQPAIGGYVHVRSLDDSSEAFYTMSSLRACEKPPADASVLRARALQLRSGVIEVIRKMEHVRESIDRQNEAPVAGPLDFTDGDIRSYCDQMRRVAEDLERLCDADAVAAGANAAAV